MKVRAFLRLLIVAGLVASGIGAAPSATAATVPLAEQISRGNNMAARSDQEKAGPPAEDPRDFGTPTAAPGKVCPVRGNVPVSVPLVNSPVGTSVQGLGGLTLDKPAIPGKIYSELCMSKKSMAAARQGNPPTVLLLVHGITYGTWYWDMPYQSDRYSTVNSLIKHGYATLNIDRIGEGRSSHPASAAATVDSNAETVHQLIGKLREGQIGGVKFGRVGLVGHSYGTAVSWLESAKHNDADFLVGTGYGSRFKIDQGAGVFASMVPWSTTSRFKGRPWELDPGYLSSRVGTRANSDFFYGPSMDPNVLALDEQLQNPVTATELATFVSRTYDGTHKNIRIPTFMINGEHDSFFCGPKDVVCATGATTKDSPETLEKLASEQTAYENPAFRPEACFRSAVIPGMGHNIAMHRNARQTSEMISYFADEAMGTQGKNRGYRKTCATREPNITDQLPEIGRLVPPFSDIPTS